LNPYTPSRNFIEIKYSFNQKLIFMGSEKIFMFGEPSCGCGGGSKADLTAILPALMNNNKGIDPGILAMLGDRDRDDYDDYDDDDDEEYERRRRRREEDYDDYDDEDRPRRHHRDDDDEEMDFTRPENRRRDRYDDDDEPVMRRGRRRRRM
jgi:hypothetical protein